MVPASSPNEPRETRDAPEFKSIASNPLRAYPLARMQASLDTVDEAMTNEARPPLVLENTAAHLRDELHGKARDRIVTTVGGKLVGRVVGGVIKPVEWMVDPEADPDVADVSLWLGGMVSAPAAFVTGLVKAICDDQTLQKLKEVHAGEPAPIAPRIRPAQDFSSVSAMDIAAMSIAASGGVAWRHPNGLWVYVADKDGKPLVYEPAVWTVIYTPRIPLQGSDKDGYRWSIRRRG